MKSKPQVSIPSAGKETHGKDFFLRGVVDRYEGDYAVLVFDDGQRLLWPREQLPTEAREGVAVAISLTVDLTQSDDPPSSKVLWQTSTVRRLGLFEKWA